MKTGLSDTAAPNSLLENSELEDGPNIGRNSQCYRPLLSSRPKVSVSSGWHVDGRSSTELRRSVVREMSIGENYEGEYNSRPLRLFEILKRNNFND
jgi:hypothetical protein